jgi:hypothetical protein
MKPVNWLENLMAETIKFNGDRYWLAVDMSVVEKVARESDNFTEFVDEMSNYNVLQNTARVAWLALHLGEFEFTTEDVLIYLIEELEHLRDGKINVHVVSHRYDPETGPMTSRISYMPDDEWRMIYDDKD